LAVVKGVEVALDTELAGRQDAMNPVELLLAVVAECMSKVLKRVISLLHVRLDGAEVRLEASRQDPAPKLMRIHHQIIVQSNEPVPEGPLRRTHRREPRPRLYQQSFV
jgi:uncharacterized OsmC-like protein